MKKNKKLRSHYFQMGEDGKYRMNLYVSKTQKFAGWESGGMKPNGHSEVVLFSDKSFNPLKVLFVRDEDPTPNLNHVMVEIGKTDYVFFANLRETGSYMFRLFEIDKFEFADKGKWKTVLKLKAEWIGLIGEREQEELVDEVVDKIGDARARPFARACMDRLYDVDCTTYYFAAKTVKVDKIKELETKIARYQVQLDELRRLNG